MACEKVLPSEAGRESPELKEAQNGLQPRRGVWSTHRMQREEEKGQGKHLIYQVYSQNVASQKAMGEHFVMLAIYPRRPKHSHVTR